MMLSLERYLVSDHQWRIAWRNYVINMRNVSRIMKFQFGAPVYRLESSAACVQ
jgi:hypothetical protein